MTPVVFVAHCLTCRGKPAEFTGPDAHENREVWVRVYHPACSVHLWIAAPKGKP